MKTTFKCFTCEKEVEHNPEKKHIPIDWSTQTINNKNYLLCDSCSMHFVGGISSYMMECFKRKGVNIK
jgi:DNA-directed RNA polymerase subunit RPC12/RpoP